MSRKPIFNQATDTRSRPVHFRLAESEVDRLVLLARADGKRSVSAYVRKIIRINLNSHWIDA